MMGSDTNAKIVTIDGPAGSGKSTIAQLLAKRLGFAFLDTGAMYRALTYQAMHQGVSLEDEAGLISLACEKKIEFVHADQTQRIFFNGQDISQEIRTVAVTNNTFYIARASGVRQIMVEWQREIGGKGNVVAEGRDIGTVVFPLAPYKFYLDADVEVRVQRRMKELIAKGKNIDEEKLKAEVKERDHKDFTRKVGPLKKADDAVVIDSTPLTIDQVVEEMFLRVSKN